MRFPAQAFWIGSEHPFDLREAYLSFQRAFSLKHAPRHAQVLVTADSRYKLWINGAFICRGPARCWPHRQQYDVVDVSAHLRAGSNLIEAQIYSPGYSHFVHVHRAVHGLLLVVEADGKSVCVTDDKWTAARDWSWRDDVRRVSIYGAGVERRDMRKTDALNWRPAKVMAPAEGPLWTGLCERDVPMLIEEAHRLGPPAIGKRGRAPTRDDPHEALREIWLGASKEGSFIAAAFDLGLSKVCLAQVHVAKARGGERLLVSYAEKLRDGDLLISDPETYCRMRVTDEFILKPGGQVAEPFSLRGGRYIVVAYPSYLDISVDAVTMRYPLEMTSPCLADPELKPIADLCLRTTLSCLQDGFVDSVWRESSQWLGDGVAQAFALAGVSDDLRPLRRMITMAAHGAYADGVLPSVLPGEVHAYTITDYNFSWIELLHFYCAKARDADAFLAEMRPTLDGIAAHFNSRTGGDGLLRSEPGRRLFLDWSPVDRREPNLTYNCRYLHALHLAAALTGDSGYAEQAAALRTSIQTHFAWDGVWFENGHGTAASQLGLSLALLTGCMTLEEERQASAAIIGRSLDLDDTAGEGKLVLASPFMHHYVFLALEKAGETQAILDIIRARWGRWAEAAEATAWENWNVDFPDGSKCHGFSAHPLGWLARLAV